MIDPASMIFPMLFTIILLVCILALMVLKLRREKSHHEYTQYQLDGAIARNASMTVELADLKKNQSDEFPEDFI